MPATVNGPSPNIPNGSGGYQLGSGNNSEVVLGYIATPFPTATDTATFTTAAPLIGELLIVTPTAAATYTLPSASLLDAAIPNARVGSTFQWSIVNTAAFTTALAMGSGTGITNGGGSLTANAASTSATYRFRKTGDAAYTVYKIA